MSDILKDASQSLKALCRSLNHAEFHGCREIRQQIESAETILSEIMVWHKRHQEKKDEK